MNRRDALTSISMAGGASLIPSAESLAGALSPSASATFEQAVRGTAPVKIRDIKTILTAPNGIRLVVVKVETTEPGLAGWGCATFTQRALVVETAIEKYLKPFLIGRNVDEIEDIWQSSYMSSYWRNGPVLFNAMSGVDIALWDIKGKRAGMPLYQLLGGKVRHGADCYFHASGSSFTEVEENARAAMDKTASRQPAVERTHFIDRPPVGLALSMWPAVSVLRCSNRCAKPRTAQVPQAAASYPPNLPRARTYLGERFPVGSPGSGTPWYPTGGSGSDGCPPIYVITPWRGTLSRSSCIETARPRNSFAMRTCCGRML